MTNSKKISSWMMAIILTVATMSFYGSGNAQSAPRDGTPKTQKEVEAALTHYSISLVGESSSQAPFYYKQIVSDRGIFFEMKCERMQSFDKDFNEIYVNYHKISFVDFTAGKAYELDGATKTGEVSELNAAQIGRFKGIGFHMVISQFLFMHENKNDMKKIGNEKVLERNATVYSITSFGDEHQKYWIDDEYGFTLKYEQVTPLMKAYVTEFIIGGATVEGMVDLSKYRIEKGK